MMKTVLEYLEETVVLYPDRYVYRDTQQAYTFQEAMRAARAIGTQIGRLHAKGQPVAVFMEKSAAMAVAILGVLYGGCCYCPIDVTMPKERIRTILSVLNPAAAIVSNGFCLEEFPELICPILDFDEICLTEEDAALLSDIRKGCADTDPLYVLFTSGSTGIPKGVMGCHRMILNNILWLEKEFPYEPDDVLGNQAPFYFVISLHDIFVPLRFGCGTFMIPQDYFSYPARLIQCLNEHRVTSIFWVPSALTVTARLNGFDTQQPKYLRYVFFIGEVMPVRYLNEWRRNLPDARFVNMYGATETHVSMFHELRRDYRDDERIPIGHACDNVTAVIVDENGVPIQPGDDREGELWIGGAALSLGYYKDRAKTEERFIYVGSDSGLSNRRETDSLASDVPEAGAWETARLYRTGDMAAYGADGEILFRGRRDLQIKRMGYRIELGEIEAAAAAIPEIHECACVYDEDRQLIYLLYTAPDKLDSRMLSGKIALRIPRYMMPNRYVRLETMPRNANGKIDRQSLKGAICTTA